MFLIDLVNMTVIQAVDVAASGGYTVSYRARSIVAGGNTITGSIGSITGKMNFRKLYNRLGITKDGQGIGPHGDFYSDYRAWTPEEYRRVVEEHWKGYSAWIDRIAYHRDLSPAEVDSVARGRVWTGVQALDRKLVDRLGGLDVAVQMVKEAAGLPEDEAVTLWHLPKPEGFMASVLG
ncbi:MAG: S49 family peptidase, partial [Proteobacteria bacterium]|nr:S49 family peptidase [Pseudomonadota bacterium]